MRKAVINIHNLKHNLITIKEETGIQNIIGVVKANGYGHGALTIVKHLFREGVKTFAVATFEEAKEILKLKLDMDVIILGYTEKKKLMRCKDKRLVQTIISINYYEEIKEVDVRKQVNINTGMNRLGINYLDDGLEYLLKDLTIEAIYTHFLNNKDNQVTDGQLKKLSTVHFDKLKHTAITDRSLLLKYNINTIRVGLSIYGYETFNWGTKLKPILSMYGKLINTFKVVKGESISYNAKYVAENDMVIGTIAIGYADGIPFNYKEGYVFYKGEKHKIVGQITMDYIMIDLTNVRYKLYDYVEIFGENISLGDIAKTSETIVYDILTKVGKRMKFEIT